MLGSDPAELFSTIMHNIEHPESARLQRKVRYDNVGGEALAEIRAATRLAGAAFIRRANTLLAAHDRDQNPGAVGGKRMAVVLGTYYYEEEVTAPPAAPAPPARPQKRSGPPGRIRRSR